MMPALAPAPAARADHWPRVLSIGLLAVIGASLLTGLGIWQLERRQWKLELIQTVDARFYAPPHALPDAAGADPATLAYEHVELSGTYVRDADTWVHASTVRGTGYWVLSPLQMPDGRTVLINRGFVPMDAIRSSVAPPAAGSLRGVLRTSEPNGHWPRRNEPAQDRWYSRDVVAIAGARGLQGVVAPFFIDADAASASGSPNLPTAGPITPEGGLTVVNFRNAHLGYALTWFTLALMTALGGGIVIRGELLGHVRDT